MEEPLEGGQTVGVVRIGDTVRRPARPNSGEIHDALRYLREHGARWAPEVLGYDDVGREILRWAPGEPTWLRHRHWWGTETAMARIGVLVRELTDLFSAHPSADGDRILTQGDLGPWNVVASDDGGEIVVIDWDSLQTRPRLWEVAHAAWAFVPLMDRNETDAIGWVDGPPDHGSRLAAFCAGYGLGRAEVPVVLAALDDVCAKATEDDVDEGAGAAINRRFISQHLEEWSARLAAALE